MKNLSLIILFIFFSGKTYCQSEDSLQIHILKFDFFSPVMGCMGFSLETYKKNCISWEVEAGFIGIKLGDYISYDHYLGGYFSVGPKIYFGGKKALENIFFLNHAYIKPEFLTSFFIIKDQNGDCPLGLPNCDAETVNGVDFSASLLMCVGKQWVLRKKLSFDIYCGLGYGYEFNNYINQLDYDIYPGFKFSHMAFGYSPVVYDAGLSIGLVLN